MSSGFFAALVMAVNTSASRDAFLISSTCRSRSSSYYVSVGPKIVSAPPNRSTP